ncbi:hypothetical protein ABPG74_003943 [Tetrahymena malaccensis]
MGKRFMLFYLATILLVNASVLQKLPNLNIDLVGTTVSGISSGAYMSGQMHVALSSFIKGSAIVAGGPVGCTRGYLIYATTECMANPQDLNIQSVDEAIDKLNKDKKIDDVSNLKGAKSYIFAGLKDTVVLPLGGVHLQDQFTKLGVQLKTVYDIPAEHAYITNNFGNVCDFKGSPYINNCNYNQAYESLNYLYGGKLKAGTKAIDSNLFEFNQQNYFSSFMTSLYSSGYVYIPTNCAGGKKKCRLHINFHGCKQSVEILGTNYITMIGINDVAEANDIVVLYPQTSKNPIFPYNPEGCWDWWGYTEWNSMLAPTGYYNFNSAGLNFLSKEGLQIKSIWQMAQDLASGNKTSQKLEQE